MICRIRFDEDVGRIGGKEHVVMNVHLHFKTANHDFEGKLEERLNSIRQLIVRHNVNVLMGDFNMACAAIIPELRKRGLVVDLGAWFPWKSSEGWPMMDTTAIIFVNMPGQHEVIFNAKCLHDDVDGFLRNATPCESDETKVGWWYRFSEMRGPGHKLEHYFRHEHNAKKDVKPPPGLETEALKDALVSMLRPSHVSRSWTGLTSAADEIPFRPVWCTKEKRIDFPVLAQPVFTKIRGSHFPLWVAIDVCEEPNFASNSWASNGCSKGQWSREKENDSRRQNYWSKASHQQQQQARSAWWRKSGQDYAVRSHTVQTHGQRSGKYSAFSEMAERQRKEQQQTQHGYAGGDYLGNRSFRHEMGPSKNWQGPRDQKKHSDSCPSPKCASRDSRTRCPAYVHQPVGMRQFLNLSGANGLHQQTEALDEDVTPREVEDAGYYTEQYVLRPNENKTHIMVTWYGPDGVILKQKKIDLPQYDAMQWLPSFEYQAYMSTCFPTGSMY